MVDPPWGSYRSLTTLANSLRLLPTSRIVSSVSTRGTCVRHNCVMYARLWCVSSIYTVQYCALVSMDNRDSER